jgi:hypothetical protein
MSLASRQVMRAGDNGEDASDISWQSAPRRVRTPCCTAGDLLSFTIPRPCHSASGTVDWALLEEAFAACVDGAASQDRASLQELPHEERGLRDGLHSQLRLVGKIARRGIHCLGRWVA